MRGLLGTHGKVKPWWLPFDWVLCRIPVNHKTRVVIIKNRIAPNVYDLAVEVINGKVTRVLPAHGCSPCCVWSCNLFASARRMVLCYNALVTVMQGAFCFYQTAVYLYALSMTVTSMRNNR